MKYDKVIYGTAESDSINARDVSEYGEVVELYGLGGNDTLWAASYMDGGDGNDTIYDGAQDSIIYGGAGNDTIFDFYGNDRFFAGSGDDYFSYDVLHTFPGDKNEAFLEDGDDTGVMVLTEEDFQQNIDGGSGFDTLIFSMDYADMDSLEQVMDFRGLTTGSMTIDGSTVKDFERVVLFDTWTTEVVYFGEYNDVFLGNGDNTRVYGFGGNDILHAGVKGDQLFGGDGNDTIFADGGNVDFHRAYGEAGNDKIYASFSNLDYSSHGRLYGDSGKDGFIHTFNNVISGDTSAFDYVMDFSVKEDWIGLATGGYLEYDESVTRPIRLEKTNIVDNKHELSFEFLNINGADSFPIRITYNKDSGNLYIQRDLYDRPTLVMNIKGAPDLLLNNFYYMTKQYGSWEENLLHGNGQDNVLQGRGGNDIVYGAGGNDTISGDGNDPSDGGGLPGSDELYGEAGDDAIYAGAGKDKITGGLGQDDLRGQSGNDTFVYTSIKDSTAASAGRDTIYDFTSRDEIDLSGIDAYSKISGNQAFKFIATDKFTGKQGEVRYEKLSSDTYIYADVNGDKKADFAIHLDDAVTLQQVYFIL